MSTIKSKALLYLFLVMQISLNAETMFTLSGIKKVYPVVEIKSTKIPQIYKKRIYNELNSTLKTLKIDTTGYSPRSVAMLVTESFIDNKTIFKMQMLIGEEVKRVEGEKVFAITYMNQEQFILEESDLLADSDELEDMIEDTVDTLLEKFSEQYREENKAMLKVEIKDKSFALELGYETNYNEALKKAKEQKKNILFVLVANYCPWCRKFEQRVLLKKEVNDAIHSKYIPLLLNREEGKFPKEFSKSMTPIVHFIDYKTGKSYHNVVGYNNREEFLFLLSQDK